MTEPASTKHEDAVLRLYEEICAIKTEAPVFDTDWDRLANAARLKRLHLIQKAFDAEWAKGYEQGRSEAL